jgi:hypothetical protein
MVAGMRRPLLLGWRRRQSEHDGSQFFELALRVGIHDGAFPLLLLGRRICQTKYRLINQIELATRVGIQCRDRFLQCRQL